MQWRGVVVVVVRASAMSAPLIQLPNFRRHFAAIILRIENRNPIRRDRDRPAQESPLDRQRRLRRHRRKRKLPRIRARVILRQRHLLLPRRDADHHVVRGHPIALDEKEPLIPAHIHFRRERLERRRLRGPVRPHQTSADLRAIFRRCALREENLRRPHRPIVVRVFLARRGIVRERRRDSADRDQQNCGELFLHARTIEGRTFRDCEIADESERGGWMATVHPSKDNGDRLRLHHTATRIAPGQRPHSTCASFQARLIVGLPVGICFY